MKNLKKSILGAALALAFSGAVQSATINVGGVVWDPDSGLDWTSTSANVRQFVNSSTGAVSGYGIIHTMNGTGVDAFCPSCYLTFQYTSYTSTTGTPSIGSTEIHTGGSLNFYVVNRAGIDPNNVLSLNWTNTVGSLWLSAAGSGNSSWSYGSGGSGRYGTIAGGGLLSVTGGAALANFNTNTFDNGADLNFTTSLTFDQNGTNRTTPWDWSGTGNFSGDSIAGGSSVPEPGTLALAGLGLLGLGLARRRQAHR